MDKNTYKTSDAIKKHIKELWEKACNSYLLELHKMWELDGDITKNGYGYWIGEKVGGMYDYDGSFTIGMDDIIYCVENDITHQQYMEWQEYICDASEFGFDMPNLKSWMNGCPRVSEEAFKRLRNLKAELAKEIEETKKTTDEDDCKKKERKEKGRENNL